MDKAVGVVETINGEKFTLAADDGTKVSVTVPDSARLLRVAPGQKDLKDAVTIHLQDLQDGDRVLVRGRASSDKKAIVAAAVIVMKKSDVASKQQSDREDWQKRGIGGLVNAVDPAGGTITVAAMGLDGKKDLIVRMSPKTVIRRYAADSVRFDDAKPSTLAEIKAGDQLRARGARSSDSSELAAEEVVSGSFRNIAGTVSAIDGSSETLTVADQISKKTITVKVTGDSQIRKLPEPVARRIAARVAGETPRAQSAAGNGTTPAQGAVSAAGADSSASGGDRAPGNSGGGDLQQMLNRLPVASLADFHKGDAVMLVSTQGNGSDQVTAITLLGGVEPILRATPKGSQPMVLSAWTISAPEGGGGQ